MKPSLWFTSLYFRNKNQGCLENFKFDCNFLFHNASNFAIYTYICYSDMKLYLVDWVEVSSWVGVRGVVVSWPSFVSSPVDDEPKKLEIVLPILDKVDSSGEPTFSNVMSTFSSLRMPLSSSLKWTLMPLDSSPSCFLNMSSMPSRFTWLMLSEPIDLTIESS